MKRKPFPFQAYKAENVKKRLEELFHGKCAYCESRYAFQAPVDVEHYRPKGRVEGEPNHPGYWWLAADWANLLPSCLDCNRRRKQVAPVVSATLTVLYEAMQTGKQDSFPVLGARALHEPDDLVTEQPLLLDPTRDEPDEHLAYWVHGDSSAGLVYPASVLRATQAAPVLPAADEDTTAVVNHAAAAGVSIRGAVSIQVYGLNRLRLVQERARLLQQLRFLESVFLDISEVSRDLAAVNVTVARPELAGATDRLERLQRRILDQMQSLAAPTSPHSAVARAYLRDFRKRISLLPPT
ncbi:MULTISPECIES: endonuclease [unclassified Bradyrhizobium]|uniref:endonuclease n=1 Tax=unclassified Bradyrhizobium TaxID=2631580 RepID=UPI001586BCA0|nr:MULTISPECIES: endonuclease [unclassified Bradyrhizobium]